MTLETWLAFFVAACLISVSPGAGAALLAMFKRTA